MKKVGLQWWCLVLMCGTYTSADAAQCVTYSSAINLRGTLTRDTFPEQPNYESIAGGDAAASYFFVALPYPICVERGNSKDGTKPAEEGILRVQLAFGQQKDPYDKLRPYLAREITCRGTLYHAISGHHHSQVLMSEPDCVTAEEFLRAVVDSDLAGEPDPRVRRVTFSTKAARARYEKDSEAGPLPEAYFLDTDPLVVVRGWKTAFVKIDKAKTCLSADFEVVARTVGRGLPSWMNDQTRHMRRAHSTQQEIIRYCAIKVDGQWMLLDPPLPRVNQSVMEKFLAKKLADAERRMQDVVTNDPRAIKNMRVIRDSLSEQLKVLRQ
jgi:hypothetical protein